MLGKARGTCVPSCAKLFCYSVTGADMRSEKSVGSAFEKMNLKKILNGGSLGSHVDEGRS